jgi:hypothetical protein
MGRWQRPVDQDAYRTILIDGNVDERHVAPAEVCGDGWQILFELARHFTRYQCEGGDLVLQPVDDAPLIGVGPEVGTETRSP